MNTSHPSGEWPAGANTDSNAPGTYEQAHASAEAMLTRLMAATPDETVCVYRDQPTPSDFIEIHDIDGLRVHVVGRYAPKAIDGKTVLKRQTSDVAVFFEPFPLNNASQYHYHIPSEHRICALVQQNDGRYLDVEVTNDPEQMAQFEDFSRRLETLPVVTSTDPEV